MRGDLTLGPDVARWRVAMVRREPVDMPPAVTRCVSRRAGSPGQVADEFDEIVVPMTVLGFDVDGRRVDLAACDYDLPVLATVYDLPRPAVAS